jgi:hypothetical protein
MKKYIFTVRDDTCIANEKDVNATRVLEVMRTYGTVEDYDPHIAVIKQEYQEALDNVCAQNEAIKAQNLSEDEIAMVNAYRTQREIVEHNHIVEKEELRQTLKDVKAKHESTLALIADAIKDN